MCIIYTSDIKHLNRMHNEVTTFVNCRYKWVSTVSRMIPRSGKAVQVVCRVQMDVKHCSRVYCYIHISQATHSSGAHRPDSPSIFRVGQ